MRGPIAVLVILLGLSVRSFGQTCTGLCLQQVSCPAGQTTSITGVVYMPNGTDPLPNALVYIPNAAVPAFTPGVSCPVPGQQPPGSPLVGTTSGVDGSFTISDVPVGTNIPLVVQSGKWRRQVVIPSTAACTSTSFSTRLPQNQTEGDIPKFAIATGSEDEVECVLLKAGISASEFTDPSGTGRIQIYSGSNSPGALIDAATPSQTALMSDPATLSSYDVLMLPCQGGQYIQPADELANFMNYANAGGRVYSSHFSYVWMYNNPPFNTVVNWDVNQRTLASGPATVNTGFPEGSELSQWLQEVGASTTQGQIDISAVKHDTDGVVAPTETWLTLNDAADGNPVMQFVFDTPVSATSTQCGRVLFNDYHVENPNSSPRGVTFPNECTLGPMTAQEKLLEYSLFELTNEGGQPTLSPLTQDFGSEAIGFTSSPQTFTWTNTSTFAAAASPATTGDFLVTSSNCNSVLAGASCQISVVFRPTALGARTGTLTVASNGTTLSASLTGTGVPDFAFSPSALNFGNVDVGAHATQTLTITNNSPGSLAIPSLILSGPYTASSNCSGSVPALGSCAISVTFSPTTTGAQPGTLSLANGSSTPVALSGNGVDFSITLNPGSGSVVAGFALSTSATTSPIAGFAAPVSLTCTTTTVTSTCTPALLSFTPSSPVMTNVNIATTSKYTVIGYGGLGGPGLLGVAGLASSLLLFVGRRRAGLLKSALLVFILTASGFYIAGCGGKAPALNSQYTVPGTYTYTLTATDGFLVHTATYSLTVTAQ